MKKRQWIISSKMKTNHYITFYQKIVERYDPSGAYLFENISLVFLENNSRLREANGNVAIMLFLQTLFFILSNEQINLKNIANQYLYKISGKHLLAQYYERMTDEWKELFSTEMNFYRRMMDGQKIISVDLEESKLFREWRLTKDIEKQVEHRLSTLSDKTLNKLKFFTKKAMYISEKKRIFSDYLFHNPRREKNTKIKVFGYQLQKSAMRNFDFIQSHLRRTYVKTKQRYDLDLEKNSYCLTNGFREKITNSQMRYYDQNKLIRKQIAYEYRKTWMSNVKSTSNTLINTRILEERMQKSAAVYKNQIKANIGYLTRLMKSKNKWIIQQVSNSIRHKWNVEVEGRERISNKGGEIRHWSENRDVIWNKEERLQFQQSKVFGYQLQKNSYYPTKDFRQRVTNNQIRYYDQNKLIRNQIAYEYRKTWMSNVKSTSNTLINTRILEERMQKSAAVYKNQIRANIGYLTRLMKSKNKWIIQQVSNSIRHKWNVEVEGRERILNKGGEIRHWSENRHVIWNKEERLQFQQSKVFGYQLQKNSYYPTKDFRQRVTNSQIRYYDQNKLIRNQIAYEYRKTWMSNVKSTSNTLINTWILEERMQKSAAVYKNQIKANIGYLTRLMKSKNKWIIQQVSNSIRHKWNVEVEGRERILNKGGEIRHWSENRDVIWNKEERLQFQQSKVFGYQLQKNSYYPTKDFRQRVTNSQIRYYDQNKLIRNQIAYEYRKIWMSNVKSTSSTLMDTVLKDQKAWKNICLQSKKILDMRRLEQVESRNLIKKTYVHPPTEIKSSHTYGKYRIDAIRDQIIRLGRAHVMQAVHQGMYSRIKDRQAKAAITGIPSYSVRKYTWGKRLFIVQTKKKENRWQRNWDNTESCQKLISREKVYKKIGTTEAVSLTVSQLKEAHVVIKKDNIRSREILEKQSVRIGKLEEQSKLQKAISSNQNSDHVSINIKKITSEVLREMEKQLVLEKIRRGLG